MTLSTTRRSVYLYIEQHSRKLFHTHTHTDTHTQTHRHTDTQTKMQ